MTSNAQQLEASHKTTMSGIVATKDQATATSDIIEVTPLEREQPTKVLGIAIITTATRKDRKIKPIVNFVKKRGWDSLKLAYGDYWYNFQNRLLVKEDCFLLHERIIIPQQLRQTILDSLHLTHSGAAAMLDLCENIWFPNIHRILVQMGLNSRHCTERGENLKSTLGKDNRISSRTKRKNTDRFCQAIPGKPNKDSYILVAIDK